MIALIALAAALPSPAQAKDIRCVAALAIVASEQKRGSGWSDVDDVQDDGADFAAMVGEDVMKTTGATREDVRTQMVAAVSAIQKAKVLPREDVAACIAAMKVRLPAAPPPTLPRCAAIMGLAYDAVKARDGLSKDAKDLGTLASVLTYRAREMAIGEGKSMAEADAAIGAERDKASRAGGTPQAELRACTTLAAPSGAR
jgi:hypothetical protein